MLRKRTPIPQDYYSHEELRQMQAEIRKRRRRRLFRATLVVLPIVAVAAGAVVAVRAGWVRDDNGGTATTDTAASNVVLPDAKIPAVRYSNEEGGYTFRYPTDWSATQVGTRTELTDPTGGVNLWMDVAPQGEREEVLAAQLPSLVSTWSLLHAEGPLLRDVGSAPAISVGGTGVAGGLMLRFLAIVVDEGDSNYVIFVSVPQDRDPVTITPQLEGIVSSFELQAAE